jgi:hypothetical protein
MHNLSLPSMVLILAASTNIETEQITNGNLKLKGNRSSQTSKLVPQMKQNELTMDFHDVFYQTLPGLHGGHFTLGPGAGS